MTRSPLLRALLLTGWLMVCSAMVASCGGDDDEAGPAPPTPPPPATPPQGGAPLTGLPIDPSRAGLPVLVVKVDNAPRARPQAGLVEADVVFEEAVEGGVTRFAILYHSAEAAVTGPVRSARSTDIFIAAALNRPLFAYSGANLAFQHLIARSPLIDVGVDRLPGDYRRERGRQAPYNQFSSTPSLRAHAPPGSGPPPRLFSFRAAGEPVNAAGATPASGVNVEYRGRILTAAQYGWDGASGTWKRSQDGGPHVVVGGAQVAPRNVVVQLVEYKDTGFRDTSGAPVPEAQLVGEGEAWVFTDGKVVRGRWRKPAPEAVTEYLDGAGAPVRLTPGQTWVELAAPGSAAIRP